MWWDTRKLRSPTDILIFDLDVPNEPQMDRAIGVSSANFEPSVSAKFMFGLENGVVVSGSKKARTPAEKLATQFYAHYSPVSAVDRNSFNPKIFLSVGDCTARIWAEDTKDYNLVSTRYSSYRFEIESEALEALRESNCGIRYKQLSIEGRCFRPTDIFPDRYRYCLRLKILVPHHRVGD